MNHYMFSRCELQLLLLIVELGSPSNLIIFEGGELWALAQVTFIGLVAHRLRKHEVCTHRTDSLTVAWV